MYLELKVLIKKVLKENKQFDGLFKIKNKKISSKSVIMTDLE